MTEPGPERLDQVDGETRLSQPGPRDDYVCEDLVSGSCTAQFRRELSAFLPRLNVLASDGMGMTSLAAESTSYTLAITQTVILSRRFLFRYIIL